MATPPFAEIIEGVVAGVPTESEFIDQTRDDLNRQRLKATASGNPLLELYRLGRLARHLPFDDWEFDDATLIGQTVQATAAEFSDICQEHELPPRVLFLIDSLLDLVEHLARPSGAHLF
jgi:hypothetical protein